MHFSVFLLLATCPAYNIFNFITQQDLKKITNYAFAHNQLSYNVSYISYNVSYDVTILQNLTFNSVAPVREQTIPTERPPIVVPTFADRRV
jgi:hypothetical protein